MKNEAGDARNASPTLDSSGSSNHPVQIRQFFFRQLPVALLYLWYDLNGPGHT